MDWFIERLHYTSPALDYRDLLNHAEDFKKLLEQKIIKHSNTLETIPCDLCDENHFVCPFRNKKGEIIISCSGSRRVVNPDELKIWTINKDTLIENVKSKNPIVDKKLFEQTSFGINRQKKNKCEVELNFPETVEWKKVLLKIKDGLQDIEIWYDNTHIKTATYIELCFSSNKKNHKADRKWNFLCILSILQNNDITQATPDKLIPMLEKYSNRKIKKDNIYQTKKLLSKKLKEIFKTNDNPFTDNKKYYEPKFKILPEGAMRTKKLWKQGSKLNENIDYSDIE